MEEFLKRIEEDREFCEELYRDATVRLLAHKYAYYVMCVHFIEDYAYDIFERNWHMMGMALGHLKQDETSPCIDFDLTHPLAKEGIALAKRLVPRR